MWPLLRNRILLLLLLCCSLTLPASASVHERQILEEFFAQTGGNRSWTNYTHWGTFEPICTWHGVICAKESIEAIENGRVIGLSLSKNGLTGGIPESLYALPSLETLQLPENHLQSAGLTGLNHSSRASPLKTLDLDGNFVPNVAGVQDAHATLMELRLSKNSLSSFPTEIPKLTQLRKLHLSYNRRLQSLPTDIGKLTNMGQFYALGSQLKGPLPSELGLMPKLKILSLSGNQFTGTLPTELEGLLNLEILNLQGVGGRDDARLKGPLMPFAQAPNLHQVHLGHHALTGSLPHNFLNAGAQHLSSITARVQLQDNQLTGTLPDSLHVFDKLDIELTHNNFQGTVPKSWCTTPQKGAWQAGLVELYGCDAILCPAGTYNAQGQQTTERDPCEACPLQSKSNLLGATECEDNNGDTSSKADSIHNVTIRILTQLYRDLEGRDRWHNRQGWEQLDPILDMATDDDDDEFKNIDFSKVVYCDMTQPDQQFYGVLCDAHQRVEVLTLPNNGLRGTIPSNVFLLPGLEGLDLSYNRVRLDRSTGFAPLEEAAKLGRLRLSRTDVSTLKGIEHGTSLQELFLDGCEFESKLPTELFDLTKLESLHMEASFLRGSLPTQIGRLTQLERLTLNENTLTGSLPSELGALTDLEHLDLSDNQLQSELPTEFNGWTRLLSLKMNRAGLQGNLLSFHALTQVEELELGFNELKGEIPAHFLSERISQNPADALVVRLTENQIEGGLPKSLAALDDLILEVEDNRITEIPAEFCEKANWMDGQVGKVATEAKVSGCDAILCPRKKWSPHGRASVRLGTKCEDCEANSFFGETTCETSGLESNPEVEILDKLFTATGGRYWNVSQTNWTKPGVPICYREGVFCGWPTPDMNSGVTELRLNKFGLRGRIPAEIFDLPRIRLLAFSYNHVDMSFEGIEKATILQMLRLSHTQVSSLKGLEKAGNVLYDIHLSSNHMQGPFPPELLQVKTLQKLFLDGNAFTGTIPTEIGGLTDLAKLSVYDNDFTGPLPTEMGNLLGLEYLDAHQNKLSGVLPIELGNLKNIARLSLSQQRSHTKITGPLLAFDTNPKLTELYLSRNNLGSTIPANILGAVDKNKLIRLDLSYNLLSGGLPLDLAVFKKLNVDVVSNQLDELPDDLCQQLDWMDGMVRFVSEEERCSAIMCPPGTASPYGRVINNAKSACKPCRFSDQAPYFGSLACLDKEERAERDILMYFFKAASGETWLRNTNWGTEKHVCSWYGITCDGRLSVVGLKLENNGLANEDANNDLMALLSGLSNLKDLDLKGNSVVLKLGNVAMDWPLETLRLSATRLESLEGIGRFKSLLSLHAADNGLSGSLPDEIYSVSSLRQIFLSFNSFNSTISPSISSLASLEQLYIFDNQISGQLPPEIGQLTALSELVLAKNYLKGTIPASLTKSPRLEQLQLQDQKGSDLIEGKMHDFREANSLWYIDLSNLAISGSIPRTFLQDKVLLNQSMSILLVNNDLSGAIPEEISRFEELDLELGGNNIEGLPEKLCRQLKWMNGDVEKINTCDAILCRAGTFSAAGRQNSIDDPCLPCDGLVKSPYLGHTVCKKIESERGVLELLFAHAGGRSWKRRDRWYGDDPICTWEGVECEGDKDSDEGVVAIRLQNNGLNGTLPSQIWSLPQLRELDLKKNPDLFVSLEGATSVPFLEKLILSGVNLESLKGVSSANRLNELEVSGLTGTLPDEIFQLKSMQALYIDDNFFVGSFPKELAELRDLRRLRAANNDFHGPIPSEISVLSNLEEFVLDDNLLSGQIPVQISSLGNLEYFSVSRKLKHGRKLSGPLPSFSNNPRLFVLHLDGNDLSGSIPSNFLTASLKIQSVDLRFNELTGSVPPELDSLEDVSLLLAGNKITDLPKAFCDNKEWMDGDVGKVNTCDAILCPPATTSVLGRVTEANQTCTPCEENPSDTYFGSTECTPPVDERSILVSFFRATGGEKWFRNDFWRTPTDHCTWYGIGCVDGQVVMINLHDNNVHGSLSPRIFELPKLQVVRLGMNPLRTTFNGIKRASELVQLQLDSVEIVSLDGIHEAQSLAAVDLKDNSLTGSFPEEMFQLSNLRILDMGGNDLTGTLPDKFQALPFLRILRLQQNKLTGTLPSFSKSVMLSEIDLSQNQLEGPISPSFLTDAPRSVLKSVDLSRNGLTTFPEELQRFDKLNIDLSSNRIESLPSVVCSKSDWNNGAVGSHGCNAILCPAGTWNAEGRQTSDTSPCSPCTEGDSLLGRTICKDQESSANVSTRRTMLWMTISILTVALW